MLVAFKCLLEIQSRAAKIDAIGMFFYTEGWKILLGRSIALLKFMYLQYIASIQCFKGHNLHLQHFDCVILYVLFKKIVNRKRFVSRIC